MAIRFLPNVTEKVQVNPSQPECEHRNKVHTRFTSYNPSADIATRSIRGVSTIAPNAIPNKKGDCQVQRLASHPFSYPTCLGTVLRLFACRHAKRHNPHPISSRLKRFPRTKPIKFTILYR